VNAIRYSTTDVARDESFAYWRDLICGVFINLECSHGQRREFTGSIVTQPMAEIEVSSMQGESMRVARTPRRIARAKDDHFLIVLQGEGLLHAQQDGHHSTLARGDWALFDSARPYVAEFDGIFRHTVLKVPRRLMRERYGPVEVHSGQRVAGDHGLGRVASSFLQSLPQAIPGLDPAAAARMAQISLDVVAAAMTQSHPPRGAIANATQVARRLQVKDYIESHLGEGDLSPDRIAAALKVSTRHLSELFEQEGSSVMRHVWLRRLQRSRLQLEDRAHASRSISSIAFALGFNSMSHFSRSFRTQFDVSPREARAAAYASPSH
jgi:AraC-like DNA-binding protein